MNTSKIAIPVDNGQLSNHFGHTQQFNIYKVKKNSVSGEEVLSPPCHESGQYPGWLANMGVTDVIACSMGQKVIALFNQKKINVFVGVTIKPPKELVLELLNGTLETSDNTCHP
ncbi:MULTISPECIES: NifB/NifX family molybdenum-iron cluster-binding protein [unclassified Saccharicrinis]|uniref:NifB/NifX family molybdenum-iron cluster-binding protein n=1 Tax=unclassified Saccharicrinis TaxID=2646859 RepID=UPI003D337935